MKTEVPMPVDPELTAISIKHENITLIADLVFPRVPVATDPFTYNKYSIADATRNRVKFNSTSEKLPMMTCYHDKKIEQAEINNPPLGHNPYKMAVTKTTDLVLWEREKRAVKLAFDPDHYGPSNKISLASKAQWDHPESDPVDLLRFQIDHCIVRPNKMAMGLDIWEAISRNPKTIAALLGKTDRQAVTISEFAEFFLIEPFVGENWYTMVTKGGAPVLEPLWQKHCLLFYQDITADLNDGITYGLTAEYGNRLSGFFEPKSLVRTAESARELIIASDLGFLFCNAVK